MNISLRKLEMKDAEGMYEWMTDPEITCFFRFDSSAITIDTCRNFISHAYDDPHTMHYAIADDNDEYLGTISLKNITETDAEYAISTRKKAHGTGAAYQATLKLFKVAFDELKLKKVYLNVLQENLRANAFYEKCGFIRRTQTDVILMRGIEKTLYWYDFELK